MDCFDGGRLKARMGLSHLGGYLRLSLVREGEMQSVTSLEMFAGSLKRGRALAGCAARYRFRKAFHSFGHG